MKLKLAFASLLVLSGCGASREALLALQDMQIRENDPDAAISYKSISGWGNDLTLNDVEVRAPASFMAGDSGLRPEGEGVLSPSRPGARPTTIAHAETMTLRGLTVKDGKPLAGDIVLNKLSPTFPMGGGSLTLNSIGFEGMNEATGKYIAGAFTKDGPGDVPALEQWGFSRAGLAGLKFGIPIPQDEAEPGAINVELADLSASALADTRLGNVRMAGLKGDVNVPGMVPVAGTFDLGTMQFSDIRTKLYASTLMASLQPLLNPDEPVDYAAMFRDRTSPLESGIDHSDWTGATINMSGLKLDVSEVHSAATRNKDDVVVATHTPRATFKFTADSSGGTLGAMGHMLLAMGGYDSNVIEAYMAGDATFDPAKDVTRLDGFNFGVTDAFDIKMSIGVVGLKQALPNIAAGFAALGSALEAASNDDDEAADTDDDDAIDEDADADDSEDADAADEDAADDTSAAADDADEDADADDDDGGDADSHDHDGSSGVNSAAVMSLVMGFLPLQLTDLDIAITDQKILDLILQGQAIGAGQSVEGLRADLVGMVTGSAAFLADAGVDPAISTELTTAVSGFLSGPGTFHITLKPKAPLGVMSAMVTPMTKENLGFSATFTPAVPVEPKTN